ncbi:UBA domain-containing protein 7 [Mycena sanguinolenta]|uniref:UBA domain-containing protein 7 n=1 Tax=Mycena sanguinolenta TaxID=230812 RepID=A0A8H6YFK3_9AGAR|nr:UBA domain-containing protein 7 [Mycena sanguinolenta]
MSDSFADLWNTTAPSKPAPQKLGSPSPALNNATVRRPQNDVFSMLSSASAPNSRPITPSAKLAAQQKPSGTSTGGGDAFSSLLGGTLSSNGNGMQNMTIAERAKRAEAERMRQAAIPKPAASTISAWDGLDSLATGSLSPASKSTSPAVLDDDWGFGAAPVAPPKAKPVPVLSEDDDWGLGFSSAPSAPATQPTPQAPKVTVWDQLDDFSPAKPSPPARYASPTADFDFGDREDTGGDDFDLLGDLGKPVEAISSRRYSLRHNRLLEKHPPPAELPTRRKPQQRSSSPPPHILGQLIEMGFSIPQARAALADVHSDGTWNVQAAIDSLLASTGGAEGSSRPATPASSNAAPQPPRRRPTTEREGRGSSPQPPQQERKEMPTLQSELLARTSEFGFSLFKNAERAWQQGRERVQKVYEEHIVGEEGKSERSGAKSDKPAARTRPKWMQDREEPEEPGPSARRQRDDSEQLWENNARGKDDGWGDSGAGGWKDDDDEEPLPNAPPASKKAQTPQPPPRKVDLFSDDAPAKPYVSPFRHGRPKAPAAPPTQQPPAARPVPPPTTYPPRPQIPVSPGALQTSRKHASTAQEKVALGQYGAALSAYTLAVDALPVGHVLVVPLLNMRALARLKEGDFRGVEADAAAVEGIAAFGGPLVEMGEAVLEAWKRRAEALEGREKWDEAGRDWERVAGAAWAKQADRDEGVRGAGRCRKMVTPVEAAPAAPKPRPKPKVVPNAGSQPPSEAVTKFRKEIKAQEEEDLAKHQLKDTVDAKLIAWKGGKETNIRALLASLDIVLWPELGLQPAGMKDLVTPGQVKIRYMKAIAKLHPDKLNGSNSTLEQRMVANGVFGALNEAWNAFK